MHIQSTSFLSPDTHFVGLFGKTVAIHIVDRITNHDQGAVFPTAFDPRGTFEYGMITRLDAKTSADGRMQAWERFPNQDWSRTGAVTVPLFLTSFVRVTHPGCLWDVIENRLYAVIDQTVVAVIGDAAKEGW